jgi:acetate kinase
VRVLVVNAGSSSLKLSVLDAADKVLAGSDEPLPAPGELGSTIEGFLAAAPRVDAAGHRVVHGGADLHEPVRADPEVLDLLRGVSHLAPLHNASALEAVEAARQAVPGVPHVLCFDTAFHAGLPAAAATYGVPWEWRERFGLRRYGFHGLSHDYATGRCAEILGRAREDLRIVSCHLGAGASLAAVAAGRSVDTTMGMTPNEGLVMATRSGSFDPGALLLVLRSSGLGVDEVEDVLERRSGLLGLSGISGDMRDVLAAADRGSERARVAVAVYLRSLRAGIATMATAMGGLDALVFTGGVGEGSARVRAEACSGLDGLLDVSLDAGVNEAAEAGDREIGAAGGVRVTVVKAREDKQIATEVRRLLEGSEPSSVESHSVGPSAPGASLR